MTDPSTVTYPLRTPALYWPLFGALCAMAAVALALVLWAGPVGIGATAIPVVVLCLLPVVFLAGTPTYRVPRGSALELLPDRVRTPGKGGPVDLPLDGLTIELTNQLVRTTVLAIPVASIERGVLLTFRSPHGVARISTLCLQDRAWQRGLLLDLEALVRGDRPLGPRPEPVLATPVDAQLAPYVARVEEELED